MRVIVKVNPSEVLYEGDGTRDCTFSLTFIARFVGLEVSYIETK
jgi:hypothetical protein